MQTVLVVEGNQMVRLALRRCLEEALPELMVLTSEDAKDAVTLAHHQRPGLILVSSQLAGATGAKLVQALRGLPSTRDLAVVGIGSQNRSSGRISAEMIDACDACLPADYQAAHLIEAIQRYLPRVGQVVC